MTMVLPVAFSLLAAARTLWGWLTLHATWTPDFDEYTKGGIGLYPSPLGRAIGASGALPYLNVAACLLLPMLAAVLAKRNGGRAWLAAFGCSLAPLAWVGAWASVDMIAVCLLMVAVYYHGHNEKTAAVFAVLATLTHWALMPFALLIFVRKRDLRILIPVGIVLFIPAVATLLQTKYGDQADKFALARGIYGFFVTLALVGLLAVAWLWPFLRDRGIVLAWLVVAAAEAGFQNHVHIRYGLPVAAIASSSVSHFRLPYLLAGRLTRHRGQDGALTYGGVTNSRHSRDNATVLAAVKVSDESL